MENLAKENLTPDELLKKHGNLIHYCIERYFHNLQEKEIYSREDLFNEGYIALMRAYDRWDPSIASFATYAIRIIVPAISVYIRKNSNRFSTPSGHRPIDFKFSCVSADENEYVNEDNPATIIEFIEDPSSNERLFEILDIAKRLAKNETEYRMWSLKYMDDLTYEEIGQIVGCSRQWCEVCANRLNRRLRHELEKSL